MVNPYYFVFYKIYRKLSSINVEEENIAFATYAVMFLIFIPHFFILMIFMKEKGILPAHINIPKHVFGIIFTLTYWFLNHMLFGYKSRYKNIVVKIDNSTKTQKIVATAILIIYFLSPVALCII